MDTEMKTLTAAPAMATVIIEPENLSRMMASFCPAVPNCNGIPMKPRLARIIALFGMHQQRDHWPFKLDTMGMRLVDFLKDLNIPPNLSRQGPIFAESVGSRRHFRHTGSGGAHRFRSKA